MLLLVKINKIRYKRLLSFQFYDPFDLNCSNFYKNFQLKMTFLNCFVIDFNKVKKFYRLNLQFSSIYFLIYKFTRAIDKITRLFFKI